MNTRNIVKHSKIFIALIPKPSAIESNGITRRNIRVIGTPLIPDMAQSGALSKRITIGQTAIGLKQGVGITAKRTAQELTPTTLQLEVTTAC